MIKIFPKWEKNFIVVGKTSPTLEKLQRRWKNFIDFWGHFWWSFSNPPVFFRFFKNCKLSPYQMFLGVIDPTEFEKLYSVESKYRGFGKTSSKMTSKVDEVFPTLMKFFPWQWSFSNDNEVSPTTVKFFLGISKTFLVVYSSGTVYLFS